MLFVYSMPSASICSPVLRSACHPGLYSCLCLSVSAFRLLSTVFCPWFLFSSAFFPMQVDIRFYVWTVCFHSPSSLCLSSPPRSSRIFPVPVLHCASFIYLLLSSQPGAVVDLLWSLFTREYTVLIYCSAPSSSFFSQSIFSPQLIQDFHLSLFSTVHLPSTF